MQLGKISEKKQSDLDARAAGARNAQTGRAQHAVPLQRIRSRFGGSLFFLEAADFGVARFEDVVDEIAALVIGQKRTLHRVDGEDFKVVQRQAKGISGGFKFFGHRGVAHQAVVGV
jgi:hypothetical protein